MSLNFRCVARHPINLESNIADLIHGASLATKGVDLFYGSARTLSESPEVLIISTGGFDSKIPHGSVNNRGKILIRPTFQVLTYDMDHDLAMERSLSILNLLNGLTNITID